MAGSRLLCEDGGYLGNEIVVSNRIRLCNVCGPAIDEDDGAVQIWDQVTGVRKRARHADLPVRVEAAVKDDGRLHASVGERRILRIHTSA